MYLLRVKGVNSYLLGAKEVNIICTFWELKGLILTSWESKGLIPDFMSMLASTRYFRHASRLYGE